MQGDYNYPERPGNLVLNEDSNIELLKELTNRSLIKESHIWTQIGHAGALSHLAISNPKGPSALDIEGLRCVGMSLDEVKELPLMYAKTALIAKSAGFSGIEIHAGHGFLLSQFLSPLFNKRDDEYGGSINARCKIILEIIEKVRDAVGKKFPIGIRINSSDQLEGGLSEDDALEAIKLIDKTSIDLIDISGGTYFPGAKASSESSQKGPYFIEFAKKAREVTLIPLMITGGFKKKAEADFVISNGIVDMVNIGRAIALNPYLPNDWISNKNENITFPRFETTIPGGITAWYTMRLTAIAEDKDKEFNQDLLTSFKEYKLRDAKRCIKWKKRFFSC